MIRLLLIPLLLAYQISFSAGKTDDSLETKIEFPSDIKQECKGLYAAYIKYDMKYIMALSQADTKRLRERCNPYHLRFNQEYPHKDYYYPCITLSKAVHEGELDPIIQFDKLAGSKEREACMRHALVQYSTAILGEQFRAFTYILNRLISMRLDDQQEMLNDLLPNYSMYKSIAPEFTEYLLRLGANPSKIRPRSSGPSLLSSAFWAIFDWGSCRTPRLMINHMSGEDLSLKYGEDEKTPLMEAISLPTYCTNEVYLMANKIAHIDTQDRTGRTALHYLYKEMMLGGPWEGDTVLEKILLKRGASLTIPDSKGVTPAQLRKTKRH